MKEVQSFGGTLTSESGYTSIVYNMTIPARHVGRALDVLSDAVIHPAFNQYTDAVAREGAAGSRRSPERRGQREPELASPGPVRRHAPALPRTSPRWRSALTLPILERFYRENFVAERTTVVVVGDVDAAQVADQIAAAFRDMPAGKARRHPRVPESKELKEPVALAQANPRETQGSVVAARIPRSRVGTADAIALDVLLAALVDAPDSRLRRRFREGSEGELAGAAAQRSFSPDPGLVALVLSAEPSRMMEAEGVLVQEIEKVRSQPITPEECDAAIRAVLERELSSRAELWGLARATALAHYQGRVGADEVHAQRVRAVRPEDLAAVARKYLDWKHGAIVEHMDGRLADSLGLSRDFPKRIREKLALPGHLPERAARHGEHRRRAARAHRPALASLSSEPFDPGRGRVERARLAGRRIRLLTSVDRSAPGVTVAVYLSGGVRYENDKNNGITSLLRETMFNTIDPKRSGLAYRQSLPLLGSMVPYQDRDMWGVSLSVPSSEWKDALGRLGTMLAHPDLDSITVDATRILLLTAYDKWAENDWAQRQGSSSPRSTRSAATACRASGIASI